MERRIIDYRKMIDEMLADRTEMDWTEVKREHLVQISFFQHERLIHFIPAPACASDPIYRALLLLRE